MPELKNSFIRGRMNLDLDERLIPNGEYREALNVQVSTSEDSDVGSVQNIIGNERFTSFLEDVSNITPVCVGSISDEKKNRFYWFIVAVDDNGNDVASSIIEHNVDAVTSTPIVIDSDNTRLEFSSMNYITGINIIDDILFFTDGITEPKKINIEHFRLNGHTDIYDTINTQFNQSDFFVDSINTGVFTKENITVIKQKPTKPPVLELERLNPSGSINSLNTVTRPVNFAGLEVEDSYIAGATNNTAPALDFVLEMYVKYTAGTTFSSPYTDIAGNTYSPPGYQTVDIRDAYAFPVSVGQTLLLSDPAEPGSLPNNAQVKIKVDNIEYVGGNYLGGNVTEDIYARVSYTILAIEQLPITDIAYDYIIENQARILFEKVFPRFSYRYKYQDGEYSAFGPFTQVSFETGTFNIHPTREPYNSAMENQISKVILKDFVTYDIPKGVVEIDLLYKPENSTTVFSIDTIKPKNIDGTDNTNWTTVNGLSSDIILSDGTSVAASDTGYYEIDSDIIYAAIPENQLLRPYDNVPKKAKSQDFTANRLIYGNYIQNLNLSSYDNNIRVEHVNRLNYYDAQLNTRGANQSVKSQRTYQIGISYLDLYGRETPIFSSGNTSSVTIPFDDDISDTFVGNASRSLQLVAKDIPKVEHVYQTVRVTGVQHSSGSTQDGRYFFFEITEMNNLLYQEYDNASLHNVKQYRAGQLIYEGIIKIWNQQSGNSTDASPSGGTTKGHGRRGPDYSASSTSDWQVDDIITIETDARFFKIFVKETASEYYNLVLDRVYRAEEDGNLWLSFPSSDRNKLKEDDFIILKKTIDTDVQVQDENKFKVIDISNEAPEFIRAKYKTLGTFDGNGDLDLLYPDPALAPRFGSPKLIISKDQIIVENTEDIQRLFDAGNGLSIKFQKEFNNGFINSQRYEVLSMDTTDGNPDIYRITLDRAIEEQDGWVEDSTGVLTPTLKTTIRLEVNRNWEEFQGRFFIKILSNLVTAQYLETQISEEFQQIFLSRPQLYALIDSNLFQGAGNPPGSSAYDQTTTPNISTTEKTDTQAKWQEVLKFGGNTTRSAWFIDEMYFASHQPTVSQPDFSVGGYGTPGQGEWITASDYQFDVSGSGTLLNAGPPGGSDLITNAGVSYSIETNGGVDFFDFGATQDSVYRFDGGIIDGFEGIFTANSTYNKYLSGPRAPRAWVSQKHGLSFDSNGNEVFGEKIYGEFPDEGNFMHLSFSKVGVDLHDGTNLNAGGDLHLWYDSGADDVTENTSSARINLQAIQNNNTQSGPARMVCNVPQINTGVNLEEKTKTQWDPAGSSVLGNYSASNETLVSQLKPGFQFTFNNDASGEVFTILESTTKRIYNHTGWNRKMKWDDNLNKFIEDTSTVHYAWQRFAKASYDDGGSSTSTTTTQRFQDLTDAIVRFGSADNRRVMYILRLDKNPEDFGFNPENLGGPSSTVENDFLQFTQAYVAENESEISENPAIFETEPKEDLDLDIYYEATQAYPLKLDEQGADADNRKGYLASSIGDRVICSINAANYPPSVSNTSGADLSDNRVEEWDGNRITLNPGLAALSSVPFLPNATFDTNDLADQTDLFEFKLLKFYKKDFGYIAYQIKEVVEIMPDVAQGDFFITKLDLYPQPFSVGLPYFNCYSFGNGVESNRIRDDFNRQFIKNGVKASTTLQEQYLEDARTSGLIFSGLYNKNTSVNDLNQFIMAEKITKELEPTYGSIQKLFARDSDLIALCEDKIVQIFADKDAIFNADGNPQLVASNRVLGQSRPFVGEYGISKNPETFASSSYRAYFTDKQRGAVLRLSMDGLTPISDAGMKDWFRDKLKGDYFNIIGSYDSNKDHYNLTFDSGNTFNADDDFKDTDTSVTITYKESVKGWVSFKGFVPEAGLSCVNNYFTMRDGQIYKHDEYTDFNGDVNRNKFYDNQQKSYITTVFNNSPTTVKNFNTINYDGTGAKGYVNPHTSLNGWVCDFFNTDLDENGQTPGQISFINKENKYFATIINDGFIISDTGSQIVDTSSFSFQGLGTANSIDIDI